jgi:N-carbamoyl-L-amino-acid hydrolase
MDKIFIGFYNALDPRMQKRTTRRSLADMAVPTARLIANAVEEALPIAEQLFDDLRRETADGVGVTRDSYGKGEQIGHDLAEAVARSLDLEVTKDPAGNLHMTLPGRDRTLPAWFIGSHLDSVLHGGNYDGAAGVVAGLTAIAALQRMNFIPARDITVMGIRAEECSTWFVGNHGGHLGSRAVLGLLSPEELDSAKHVHSGKCFAECMDAAGFDSSYFRKNDGAYLKPDRIHGYLELHIEQGPLLEHRGLPVGIVTGIRGALRPRSARTLGAYTHSGAVPQEMRCDAVLATADLVLKIEEACNRLRAAGRDVVYAVGKFYTDPEHHSIVKVPGEVNFAFDVRSQEIAVLKEIHAIAATLAKEIGVKRQVSIDLGPVSLVRPAVMDSGFRKQMEAGCADLALPYLAMPSGAGHDAADFHDAGIRSAMIFVRNAHGSHNPDEAMSIHDFELGTKLLTWMLAATE